MARQRKCGVVHGDRRLHAVALRLAGPKAFCGAGRIVLTMPDRFDPSDRLACPNCAALVSQTAR